MPRFRKGVIKTFIIDAPTILLFGFIFAWFNREDANGAEILNTRMFRRGMILTTVFIAAALWSYAKSPDWMWMYYPPVAETPILGIIYVLVFMYYIHFAFGYILGVWLERKKKHLSWAGSAVALALNGVIMALTYDRYLAVGTYEQFHGLVAEKTISFFDPANAVYLPMNVGGGIVGLYAAYCIFRWWKEGKKA